MGLTAVKFKTVSYKVRVTLGVEILVQRSIIPELPNSILSSQTSKSLVKAVVV